MMEPPVAGVRGTEVRWWWSRGDAGKGQGDNSHGSDYYYDGEGISGDDGGVYNV